MSTKYPELERGSKMRLFETNENEAIDSPTPRNNEDKIPHCKRYNPMMELNQGARGFTTGPGDKKGRPSSLLEERKKSFERKGKCYKAKFGQAIG